MSKTPYSPTQSPDIFDNDPHRNPEFLDLDKKKDGIYVAKKRGQWCKKCGWAFSLDDSICPECGGTSTRRFDTGDMIGGLPTKGQVAHFLKPVLICWNSKESPSGEVSRHPIVEQVVAVVNLDTSERHLEVRCKTCQGVYTRHSGRAATPQELQDCINGKIQKASPFEMYLGTGGAR